MGVKEGDLEKFKADVRANLEREVSQRLKARTKTSVMDGIAGLARIDLPKSLVDQESQALAERMREDLKGRGVDVKDIPVPPDAFKDQAERRVRLGLIVAEIVKKHGLQAKPDQIRKQIEEFSQTYEILRRWCAGTSATRAGLRRSRRSWSSRTWWTGYCRRVR
jgi:trigger factor